MRALVRPPRLQPGNCIGIFTPSSPLHAGAFLEKFQHGKAMLERAGFKVKLGGVTASGKSEGYRSAGPLERAREFMDLYLDPTVHGLMSTVGGYNTSSFIEHLDYEAIRLTPKVVVGYSDLTSLHCAILTRAGVSTFYGPALFPSFGEWPQPPSETVEGFLEAVSKPWTGPRVMPVPSRWSRHFRNATNGEWKNVPRQWVNESGWRVLRPGMAEGPLYALNLNTLLTHAGTDTFPDLEGGILGLCHEADQSSLPIGLGLLMDPHVHCVGSRLGRLDWSAS
jgi:muramoyltetrapeptide carboxypeptidase